MRVWLAWRRLSGDEGSVAGKLGEVFNPIAGKAVRVRSFESSCARVVCIERPWVGWRPAFVQEDERTWASSADYPMNAAAVLRGRGHAVNEVAALPALCRELERQPLRLLEDLSPPFSVVWSSKDTGEVRIQNDGLGQSQVFEYSDGRVWAASNKIAAFAALGLTLEPEPLEWALWATLGWFPLQMSGYRNVRFLEPGTRLRVSAQGVQRERFDALARWVTPDRMSPEDCLELARESLLDQIRASAGLWDAPEVGLTGGWDSRAVVSSLRAAGIGFSATVRGLPGRADVTIASELARIAGIELRVQGSGGLPPEDVGECRRCIERALLWQGGHAAAHRHKLFMAGRERIKLRPPSVTGQHGEIARRERALFGDDHARRLRALDLTEAQYEEFTLTAMLEDAPAFLRADLRDGVNQAIWEAYRQGDRYGLTGLRRVDFFCLNEFTRRKGAAVHAWQARAVVAPFLNPGFIRAIFGYPARRERNVFHRQIIAANSPDWVDVPFTDDLESSTTPASDWKRPTGRENYDSGLYWQTVGRPLIDEALKKGGFWAVVFDRELTATHWQERPDLLPVLYLLEVAGAPGRPYLV